MSIVAQSLPLAPGDVTVYRQAWELHAVDATAAREAVIESLDLAAR